jgi:hypothetical protein
MALPWNIAAALLVCTLFLCEAGYSEAGMNHKYFFIFIGIKEMFLRFV